MKKMIGLFLLGSALLTSGSYAQEIYAPLAIVGIGATLEKVADGKVQVNALIPNAPAERAGLAVGDLIVEVKSTPNSAAVDIRSLPLADVVALIRGPIGVPVEISFIRGNSEPNVVSMIREEFAVDDGD